MRPFPASSLILLALFAPAFAARGGPERAPRDLGGARVDAEVRGLQAERDELWALGAAYKARIDAHGIEFVPALGRDEERTLALGLALVDARRGGSALALTDGAAPARTGELAAERPRGGLVETYAVRTEGVELAYVVPSLPGGDGDLVLRLAVATELERPAPGAYPDGLVFRSSGGAGVSVGGVTAIDARGRSVAGELVFDGAALSLVVPAAFVRTAELPLLVDPLVSVIDVTGGSGDHRAPDVAYDETTDTYLCAWQRWYSSTDSDTLAQRLASDGSPIGSTLGIELSIPDSSELPAVGNCAQTDRFLVVWQEEDPVLGWNVRCRSVRASDGSLSSAVVVAATTDDEIRPDVNSNALSDKLIVVWEREDTGIYGRRIQVPASGSPVAETTFPYEVSADASKPAISKASGGVGDHLVVWQAFYSSPAPGDHDLIGTLVNVNAVPLTNQVVVAGIVGEDESEAEVDGDGERWLVAYEHSEALFTFDHAVRAATVRNDDFVLAIDASQVPVDDVAGVDDGAPQVAFTGESYLVGYASRSFVDDDYVYRLRTLDPWCGDCNDVAAVEGPHETVGTPFGIASERSGSITELVTDRALAVYAAFATPLSGGQIQAVAWEAEDGSYSTISALCGTSTATAPCARAGNQSFTHRLIGATPGRQAWLVLGTQPGFYSCGPSGCYLAVDPFSALVIDAGLTDASGHAQVATPLPDSPALVGLSFREQWAVAPAFGAGSCPALGVDLSDGLIVTVQ